MASSHKTPSPRPETYQITADTDTDEAKDLRRTLNLIVRHLRRELETELRQEAEYRAEGRSRLASAACERAWAYDLMLCYVEGAMSTLDNESMR